MEELKSMDLSVQVSMLKDVNDKIAELELKQKQLKESILKTLKEENLNEFKTADDIIVKVIDKTTYKYTDELSMIKWLKENGYTQFVSEGVTKTSLNKELGKEGSLTESLSGMYTKVNSSALTLKESK